MTTLAVTCLLAIPAAQAEGSVAAPGRDAGPTQPSAGAAPEHCPAATRAVKFYAGRVAYWRSRMGSGSSRTRLYRRLSRSDLPGRCPRYLARVLQRKAHAARKAYERWHSYEYDWRSWLPAKWIRIAICETGLNWRHSNSSYEGAFGFAKNSWDQFKYHADRKAVPYPEDAWQATPRQQYEVALAIYRMFGLSGWGCRNA